MRDAQPSKAIGREASRLDRLQHDITAAQALVAENTVRLRRILDRAIGLPSDDAEGGPQPVAGGVFGAIEDQIRVISATSSKQSELLDRLEQTL